MGRQMRVGSLKMAIFASFDHCLPNILHTWPHDSFHMMRLSMTLGIFQGHWTVSHQISQKLEKLVAFCVPYGKSYYRLLIGNHTLAFDWCHFWRPWSPFEGHFRLGCHFHVHFSNPWNAFASHGLPAIAELLVGIVNVSFSSFFQFSSVTNTRGHRYKLYKPYCSHNTRSRFFAEGVINVWNCLPRICWLFYTCSSF